MAADPAPIYEVLRDALETDDPVALVTITEGPNLGAKLLVRPGHDPIGTLGDPDLDRVVTRDALAELDAGLTSTRHYGRHGEARERELSVFIESFAPPPRLIIFGAVDFTAALARVGKVLGFRVTVCDAARCSPRLHAFRWPMKWSTIGLIATSQRSAIGSVHAMRCAY